MLTSGMFSLMLPSNANLRGKQRQNEKNAGSKEEGSKQQDICLIQNYCQEDKFI